MKYMLEKMYYTQSKSSELKLLVLSSSGWRSFAVRPHLL